MYYLKLLAVLAVGVASEPVISLTVENRLDYPVSASLVITYTDSSIRYEDELGEVATGSRQTWGTRIASVGSKVGHVHTVVAKDAQDDIVFSQDYTWDELKRMKWTVVIARQEGPK